MKMELRTVDGHADLTTMLDFFKCTPPLENLIGGCNQEGETRAFTERITAKMRAEGAFTYPWVLLMHMNG
jgi:hypothetical protein